MVNKGQFSAENQPKKRKGRGKSERTKWIEALQRNNESEESFQDAVILQAMGDKNPIAMEHILKRISPIPKPVAPTVEFELTATEPHEKAFQILDGIACSQIPPDIGNMLIQSIKSTVDIEEYTDLKQRIESLERKLGIE